MDTLQLILCIALMVLSVFLVVVVLMQSGKNNKLSGTITGSSSDSFYGKAKGRTADAILSKITAIVAVVFALIVIAVYIIQARPAGTESTGTGDETSISEPGAETGTEEPAADEPEADGHDHDHPEEEPVTDGANGAADSTGETTADENAA